MSYDLPQIVGCPDCSKAYERHSAEVSWWSNEPRDDGLPHMLVAARDDPDHWSNLVRMCEWGEE